MRRLNSNFSVQAVVDLGHYIGPCQVGISANAAEFSSDGYFEVVYITNKFGDMASESQLEAINGNARLMGEIAEEVHQHFVCQAEAAADAAEDR
jgi:hypothetical protein